MHQKYSSAVQRSHQPLISDQFHQIRQWCAGQNYSHKTIPINFVTKWTATMKRMIALQSSLRLHWKLLLIDLLLTIIGTWPPVYLGGNILDPPSPLSCWATSQPWALTPAWPPPPSSCLFTEATIHLFQNNQIPPHPLANHLSKGETVKVSPQQLMS